MEFETIKVLLELPGELVVMVVPKVKVYKSWGELNGWQLPFPPPYDTNGERIGTSHFSSNYDSGQANANNPPGGKKSSYRTPNDPRLKSLDQSLFTYKYDSGHSSSSSANSSKEWPHALTYYTGPIEKI